MKAETKAAAEKLKAQHGEVFVLSAKSGEEIIVKAPGGGEWDCYLDDREKIGAKALKGLLRSCALHPDENGIDAILAKRPALANVFGVKLMELAGLDAEAEAKKV